jgi:hypothetical protein
MKTNIKRTIKIILLTFVGISVVYAVAKEVRPKAAPQAESSTSVSPQTREHKIVAYYFHTTFRCPSCKKIESYSAEAIEKNFSDKIEKGSMEWRIINIDDPENKHYIKDYNIHTKSLVIAEIKDGKQVKWKNLEKIWEYLGNKEKFLSYVKAEVDNYTSGVSDE